MTCMNLKRAGWAAQAVKVFAKTTGAQLWPEAIADLLCDLGHLCDRQGLDFNAVAARAIGIWRIEQEEPEGVSAPYPVSITIRSANSHPSAKARKQRRYKRKAGTR